jgi:hypothetical protein
MQLRGRGALSAPPATFFQKNEKPRDGASLTRLRHLAFGLSCCPLPAVGAHADEVRLRQMAGEFNLRPAFLHRLFFAGDPFAEIAFVAHQAEGRFGLSLSGGATQDRVDVTTESM